MAPRLDARHARGDRSGGDPPGRRWLLVAAIAGAHRGTSTAPGRSERAAAPTERIGDDHLDGQWSGSRRRRRRHRCRDRACRWCHRRPALGPSPCHRGDGRHRHQLDAAVQAGHPPLVLVLDPRRRAPRGTTMHTRVRAGRTWSVMSYVDARWLSVPNPTNEPLTHTNAHRVRRADAQSSVRRGSRPGTENSSVDAGRVVGRDVRRLAGEGHPHVEVDRRAAVVAAVRRQTQLPGTATSSQSATSLGRRRRPARRRPGIAGGGTATARRATAPTAMRRRQGPHRHRRREPSPEPSAGDPARWPPGRRRCGRW